MTQKNLVRLTLIISALCFSAVSWSEASRYEEPIRYRKAVMTLVKRHYDKVSAMAKGSVPFNREELQQQTGYLEMLSKLSLDGFIVGSHEGDTKAKAEIWSDWARFRAAGEKFQVETVKLKEFAKKGPQDGLKAALSDLTRACKNCHDDFKAAS
jgi:cytochrome c556